MSRKLILTPYEHGYLAGMNWMLNEKILRDFEPIDIPHLLLSSVTMAGVDSIHSIGKLQNSQTQLVKKILPKTSIKKFDVCKNKVDLIFEKYKSPSYDKKVMEGISRTSWRISQLLYAMKENYSILLLGDLFQFDERNLLPPEIQFPVNVLFSAIQTKDVTLPVVRQDLEKKDIRKIIEVLDSKEYRLYQEAQCEIELGSGITNKTINSIEKAGKEFYKRNRDVINLRENAIKAIPVSSKVIDLFFGRLPGILAEYAGGIINDFLKLNKTIPLYSCENIITDFFNHRFKHIKIGDKNIIVYNGLLKDTK